MNDSIALFIILGVQALIFAMFAHRASSALRDCNDWLARHAHLMENLFHRVNALEGYVKELDELLHESFQLINQLKKQHKS